MAGDEKAQQAAKNERIIERIEAQMLERYVRDEAFVADFITDDEIERFVRSLEKQKGSADFAV